MRDEVNKLIEIIENNGELEKIIDKHNNARPKHLCQKLIMREYEVLKGDTLSEISKRFYGTKDFWSLIRQKDGTLICPKCIKPGDTLHIPIIPNPLPSIISRMKNIEELYRKREEYTKKQEKIIKEEINTLTELLKNYITDTN